MKNKVSLLAVIVIALEFFLPLQAQNKKGLQTPYVWMCTSPVDNKIDSKYVWRDLNGNGITLNTAGNECVNNRSDIYTYNFFPSLSFYNNDNYLLRIEGAGLQKATIIGVYGFNSEEDHVEDGFVMNLSNGLDEEETAITKAKIIHTTSSTRRSFVYQNRNLKGSKPSGTNPQNNKETQKYLRIMSYTKSLNPRASLLSSFCKIKIGGMYEDGVTSKAGIFETDSFPEKLRANRKMSIPEFLVYDKALTDTARLRAETYLALKYGITLDVDYLLDNVVWKNDSKFTRVCGYGRLDRYNFNQSWVTTSERELPYYLKDTYYKNSFLNKSAYENLLVAGRFGVLEDNTLMMFADNDEPVEINRQDTVFAMPADAVNFVQSEDSVMYFPLKRLWRFENLSDIYEQGEQKKLELSGAEVVETFAGSYTINVTAEENAQIEDLPAFLRNGEISWVASKLNGDMTVNIGNHIFKFTAAGSVLVDNKSVNVTYKADDMIEVVRKDTFLFVRKNGINIPSTRIECKLEKTEWDVLLASNGKAFEVKEFHYVSDNEPNDYVELSYDYEDSLSFYSNGNIYLITSKTADFKSEDADLKIYRMSSKDRARSKVTFENLAWEPGASYFTFAISGEPEVGVADKKYLIEEIHPTCSGDNSNSNGKVIITFPDDQTYAYTLAGDNGAPYFRNPNARNVEEINNVWRADYVLYITPFDGVYKFNVIGHSETPEMISMKQSFNNRQALSASWTVGDAKAFNRSGLTSSPQSNILCGVQIEDGKIYKVENSTVNLTDYYEINDGDIVTVAGAGYNRIKVSLNGVEIFDMTQNMDIQLFWTVLTAEGNTVKRLHFEELSIAGCTPVAENERQLVYADGENLSFQEVDLFTYPIEMYCEDGQGNEGDDNNGEGENEKNLYIYPSSDYPHWITIEAHLPKEYWANIEIINTIGITQYNSMSLVSDFEKGIFKYSVFLQQSGAYVVNVKSQSGTLSEKFMVK